MDRSPFLVACDDAATVEAALNLLEKCDDSITDQVVTPSDQNLDVTLLDLSEFLTHVDIPSPKADKGEPSSPSNEVAGSSTKIRRRVTPKQEIEKLRQQERELATRLEMLRLEAYDQKQRATAPQNVNVRPFWKKVASRQQQSRLDSERENRRLRSLLMLHVGRAKRMKLAWNRQMTAEGFHEKKPQVSCGFDVPDTTEVMHQLGTEVDAVYASLDEFEAGVWQESRNQIPFLEHSEVYTLPFERQKVDRAMWHAMGARFNNQERRVDANDNTITCHVLRFFRRPNMNLVLRVRWVAKKYREADRTVVIARAWIEPQNLPTGVKVGFRETQLLIFSSSGHDDTGAALTRVDTSMRVTCNGPGGGNGNGMRAWTASTEATAARNMWMQAFQTRKTAIEDRLFEDTRTIVK